MTEIIFSILIFIIPCLFLVKYKTGFIYIYLVLSVLIDVSLGFIDQKTNMIALSRAAIALAYIFTVYKQSNWRLFKFNKIFKYYFILILILSLFSSNFNISFSSTLKMIITFSMFPIGMIYFDSIEKLKKLNLAVIWIMILVTLNFIITNIFGIGANPYGDSVDFYVGNIKLSAINTPVYALLILTSILTFNKRKHKFLAIIFAIPTLVFLVLSMKRISILALTLGVIIIFFFSKSKAKFAKWIVLLFLVLIILFPTYKPILNQQISARGNRLEVGILEEESRFLETFIVVDKTIFSNNIPTILFGQEIWNSVGNYNGKYNERPLHVDFNRLLFGTGLVGLLFYILMYFKIFFHFNKIKSINPININTSEYTNNYNILRPLFLAIFFGTLLISFSGGMMGISHRTIAFLYMGAIIGFLRNKK